MELTWSQLTHEYSVLSIHPTEVYGVALIINIVKDNRNNIKYVAAHNCINVFLNHVLTIYVLLLNAK